MTSKDAFLAEIAKRLGRERQLVPPARDVCGAPEHWQQYQLSPQERIQRFSAECEQLGAKVYLCHSQDQVQTTLQALLEALATQAVLAQFETYRGQQAPAAIQFISGPSRSADIENDLTIGVHGPAALYVLLLDDTGQLEQE